MRGISLKAIGLAFIATIGLDIMSGLTLTAILGGPPPGLNSTQEERDAYVAALAANPAFLAWSFVLGTASTIIGGYLAARLARFVPYMNALAFGIVGATLGVLTGKGLPPWFIILGAISVVPAALLGGHIAKRQIKNGA